MYLIPAKPMENKPCGHPITLMNALYWANLNGVVLRGLTERTRTTKLKLVYLDQAGVLPPQDLVQHIEPRASVHLVCLSGREARWGPGSGPGQTLEHSSIEGDESGHVQTERSAVPGQGTSDHFRGFRGCFSPAIT
jgi:hypothetical protein